MEKLITLDQVLATPIGKSVCDMHYGMPFGNEVVIESIEIPTDFAIELAEKAMGHSGYTNKMLILIAKGRYGAVLVWNYDDQGYIMQLGQP